MKNINKGETATTDGVLLTNKEYEEYLRLKHIISEFKTYRKQYDETYRSYL